MEQGYALIGVCKKIFALLLTVLLYRRLYHGVVTGNKCLIPLIYSYKGYKVRIYGQRFRNGY